jgi:hypothetical protein
VISPILNQPSIRDQIRQKATNRIVITGDPMTSGLDIEPFAGIESHKATNLTFIDIIASKTSSPRRRSASAPPAASASVSARG